MNERIQELARRVVGKHRNDVDSISLFDEQIEKFAELIVRECRKVIIDDMDSNPDDEAFNDALDHAQSIIGEHFGVEE